MNFLEGRGRRKNRLDFGGDLDSFLDPGSFSRIVQHCKILQLVLPPGECV